MQSFASGQSPLSLKTAWQLGLSLLIWLMSAQVLASESTEYDPL